MQCIRMSGTIQQWSDHMCKGINYQLPRMCCLQEFLIQFITFLPKIWWPRTKVITEMHRDFPVIFPRYNIGTTCWMLLLTTDVHVCCCVRHADTLMNKCICITVTGKILVTLQPYIQHLHKSTSDTWNNDVYFNLSALKCGRIVDYNTKSKTWTE